MMAQPVPHQDKKRVKVYELRNNDWFDRGTGFCTAKFATDEQGHKDPKVIVESEDQPERLLLETTIQKQDGFQKQQETLIVWQEPGSGVDMALSFQEAEGCAMIWRYINTVQQTFQHEQSDDPDDNLDEEELAIDTIPAVSLPDLELDNLAEIEVGLRTISSTAAGRQAVAKYVVAENYIDKLIPYVEVCEDMESLSDLHHLCNIMKTILLLNDSTIIEHAVSDECLLGVVGALEFDPDFPSHKANHRHWLCNQGRFKEVVPIDDENIRRKIHQTYRLQYLKDVVLARILDDPTFSVLSSLIFFNQVEIVQHLQSSPGFLMNLFGIFSAHYPDTTKRREAVLFIQQCCAIAKTVQAPTRHSLYSNFLNHGLLRVIYYGLKHVDVAVRVGAMEILVSIIEHDPTLIRQTIFRHMHEGSPSLVDCLIDLHLVEVDLGIKFQISEALRVILDHGNTELPNNNNNNNNMANNAGSGSGSVNANANGNANGNANANVNVNANGSVSVTNAPRQQFSEYTFRARLQEAAADPQHEYFLSRFYDTSATRLFKPIMQLDSRPRLDFTVPEAAMFSGLLELLALLVRQHHRFSRGFFIVHNLAQQVVLLLKCRDKYLQLASIRFFRQVVGLQEDLYVNNLIANDVMAKILDVLIATVPRDNLVSAACTELFDFIRRETLKDLVKQLVADHRTKLLLVDHVPPCRDLVMRYDHTQGFTINMDIFIEKDEGALKKAGRILMMDAIDQIDQIQRGEYWNSPDPDDDNEDQGSGVRSGGGGSSKPLVDYDSDEDDEDDNNNNDQDADGHLAPPSSSSASPTVPRPERLSEKRRREADEDDDDDELGKLMYSKRRNSSSAESNSSVTQNLSRKRKNMANGAGSGVSPRKIAISLSLANLRSGSHSRSDDDS
ncbi:DUF625 domain-containing protein [Trichoderma austrokoningii]